jgi:hypothetical protein
MNLKPCDHLIFSNIDAEPFGSITFSAPNSYTVDTSTLDYCGAAVVDSCTIMEPTEALLGSK